MWNYRVLFSEQGNGKKIGLVNIQSYRTMTRPEIVNKVNNIFPKFGNIKILDYQIEPVRKRKRKVYC